MRLLKVCTLEEARERLAPCLALLLREEDTPLSQWAGRVLSRDVLAPVDVPAFARSTVDGLGVIARDLQAAGEGSPVLLKIIGEVAMGEAPAFAIKSGECALTPTGGMLPRGADGAVMTEFTEAFDKEHISVTKPLAPGENTVLPGEDVKEGSLLLKRGTRIGYRETGALAGAGIDKVKTYRPLNVTVISTGDELLLPGEPPRPGRVYDANGYALEALCKEAGLRPIKRLLLLDEEETLKKAAAEAMRESDVILVSGGSSKGEKDRTAAVFSALSNPGVLFHGLALKPGKPAILSFDRESKTLLLGLPGHPAAALTVLTLTLLKTLQALQGEAPLRKISCILTENVACDPGKANCIFVTFRQGKTGPEAVPLRGKSGFVTLLSKAEGFILTERNAEGLRAGTAVEAEAL